MKIKEIVLGVAIIILTLFVAFYGINAVFPEPDYNSFCEVTYTSTKPYPDRSICPSVCVPAYEIIKDKCVYNECGSGCGPDEINTFSDSSSCETALYDFKCHERYEAVAKERAKKVFFIALPLGVLIIASGAFIFGLEVVGAGLMGGGIGTLIYGSGAYWPYTENWIRFALSLVGLVLVIWLTYYFSKKFGKNRKEKKRK